MTKQTKISDWINQQLSNGKYSFTLEYLLAALPGKSVASVKLALSRLVDKGKVISVFKGFYIIIPLLIRIWVSCRPSCLWMISICPILDKIRSLLDSLFQTNAKYQKTLISNKLT